MKTNAASLAVTQWMRQPVVRNQQTSYKEVDVKPEVMAQVMKRKYKA